jgi:methyltransferase
MVSATVVLWALIGVVAVQRVSELRLARRNEAWARAQGAREYGAGHYPAFFLLHGAWLLLWPLEAWRGGPTLAGGWWLWLLLFAAAEALRYWAIGTLGSRWNTRILVIPGLPPISRGPYRWLRHPNYVAVVIELAALPLVFGAWRTALVVGAANLALLLGVRIPAEMRALAAASADARDG